MLRCIGRGPEASQHRLLFVRERDKGAIEGTFRCLGQVDLIGDLEGERPVGLTWKLRQPLPEIVFESPRLRVLADPSSRSAAAGGAAAALADVAGAGGAHLGAAGHAERGVDGGAGDLLEELGGGVGLLGGLGGDLALLGAVGVLGLDDLGVDDFSSSVGFGGLDRLDQRGRVWR